MFRFLNDIIFVIALLPAYLPAGVTMTITRQLLFDLASIYRLSNTNFLLAFLEITAGYEPRPQKKTS
jgi:hypothetical protein